MKTYYMHTADGRPAFYDGDQIVMTDTIKSSELCTSLRKIRTQQAKSLAWRQGNFPKSEYISYGYVRIVMED